MGIGEALLAEGIIVLLGVVAAKFAEVDLWELLMRHPFSGTTVLGVTVFSAFNVGKYWRRDQQMKADVAHIKTNMITAEKLENTLLKLEDRFDEKYVTRDEWRSGLTDKPNGKMKGGERTR